MKKIYGNYVFIQYITVDNNVAIIMAELAEHSYLITCSHRQTGNVIMTMFY